MKNILNHLFTTKIKVKDKRNIRLRLLIESCLELQSDMSRNCSASICNMTSKTVLGNWAKTLHPQNIGFTEFVNKFVSHLRGGKLCLARRKHSRRNPDESHALC
jgi:hypothetical protein